MNLQSIIIMPIIGVLLIASYGFGAILATVNFANQLNANFLDNTDISIEQTA